MRETINKQEQITIIIITLINTCSMQDPPMNAKVSEQKFEENQDICVVPKYYPQDIC